MRRNDGSGAKAKVALYRETLRTTDWSAGGFSHRQGAFATIPSPSLLPPLQRTPRPQCCVFEGMSESIWSDGVLTSKPKSKSKPNPRTRPTASRWSAPHLGKRTRREDHVLSHRPQMSSGRLFLDRVARQHCPSPLHRHTQINMHSTTAPAKGDISTLREIRHFYFALTDEASALDNSVLPAYDSPRVSRRGRKWAKISIFCEAR